MSLWIPQAIHAAAELGIADALAQGALEAKQLAARLQTHAEATARLLDGLVVLGILVREQDAYALTELGQFLRSDVPGSRRAWARLMGSERVWRAWGRLTDCVRTGRAAFASGEQRRSDTETFDVLIEDQESADVFHRAMADGTEGMAADVAAAVDLQGARTVIDVGGGYGALLCAFLAAHPDLRGQVFDRAYARAGAEQYFERHGVAARARFVAGDFFEDALPTADLLLLKSVIHDWDDEHSLKILARCREAMGVNGRLILVEPPAAPPGAAVPASFAWVVAFSDLNMLVNTGGRERTAADYTALVQRAGLRVKDQRATASGFYSCCVCERA